MGPWDPVCPWDSALGVGGTCGSEVVEGTGSGVIDGISFNGVSTATSKTEYKEESKSFTIIQILSKA